MTAGNDLSFILNNRNKDYREADFSLMSSDFDTEEQRETAQTVSLPSFLSLLSSSSTTQCNLSPTLSVEVKYVRILPVHHFFTVNYGQIKQFKNSKFHIHI